MSDDERHMRRAIELSLAACFPSPNPRVGAVLVRNGAVLGEGSHEGPGCPHAEIEALAAAESTAGSTLYVNLEPCTHQGRTPPCVPALVSSGVERVVASLQDPDERVAGRGFEALRAAGVEVATGTLAAEAERANAPYVHHRRTGRPLVSLKLALTLDGRMSARDGSSRWITGPDARRRVHERRASVDAVMVGAGTVASDDPSLTVRHPGAPRQPGRVIVDGSGRTPAAAAVLAPGARVLIATTDAASHDVQTAWKEAGAEVVVLPAEGYGVALRPLLEHLGDESMLEVMCEGGARLATSLLREDLVDRLEVHIGPLLVGDGGAALGDLNIDSMSSARRWTTVSVERCGEDALLELHRASG